MTNNQNSISQLSLRSYTGRVSVPVTARGSITIEASLVIPLFMFAVICLLYLMEIMAIQTAVRAGLQYAGKNLAQETSALSVLNPSKVEEDVINAIGTERLDRSIIVGGSSGLDFHTSRMSVRTGIGELSVKYQLRIPVPVFKLNVIEKTETMKIKCWTGYVKEVSLPEQEKTVYMTPTGLVYHTDYHCTYLELSVHMVTNETLDTMRNKDGEKYYPCEYCGNRSGGGVYITDYGNRYHGSLSCSGLKRTIYAVPLSEALGKGACSKCGG